MRQLGHHSQKIAKENKKSVCPLLIGQTLTEMSFEVEASAAFLIVVELL